MQATKVLSLAFLHPEDDDPFENRLTARLSGYDVCHTELVFEGRGNGEACQSFSIFYEYPAALRAKTFSNPKYELISLSVSAREYDACWQFCTEAHKAGYTFDSFGMYAAMFHPGGCIERPTHQVGRTFCSKIITEAMQAGEIPEVEALSPSATTPASLYVAVSRSARKVCSSVRLRLPGFQLSLPTLSSPGHHLHPPPSR